MHEVYVQLHCVILQHFTFFIPLTVGYSQHYFVMIYCAAEGVCLCLLIGTGKALTFCGLLLMGQILTEHASTTSPKAHNSMMLLLEWNM